MKLAVAVLCIALATPAHGTTWFGLVDTGELFASSDQGATWTILTTLPVRDAVALAAGSTSSDLYLASRSGVVYRSTNAGSMWSAVGSIDASDVADLLVRPDLSILVLTATGGIYRSTDQGASFMAIASLASSNFVSLARDATASAHYVLTATGGVFESRDGGLLWAPKGRFTAPDAVEIRAASNALIAVTSTGDTYRSIDAGANWDAIGTLSHVGTSGLVVDGGMIVAALETGEIATSPTGATWTWQGAIDQLRLTALATDASAVTDVVPFVSPDLGLSGPWPNPARPGEAISIALQLGRDDELTVTLVDVSGRRVATLESRRVTRGRSVLTFTPTIPAAGIYFMSVRSSQGLHAKAKWALAQ